MTFTLLSPSLFSKAVIGLYLSYSVMLSRAFGGLLPLVSGSALLGHLQDLHCVSGLAHQGPKRRPSFLLLALAFPRPGPLFPLQKFHQGFQVLPLLQLAFYNWELFLFFFWFDLRLVAPISATSSRLRQVKSWPKPQSL